MSLPQVVCGKEVRENRSDFFSSHNELARRVHRYHASVYFKIWPAGPLTSDFAEWFALPLAIPHAKNVFWRVKGPRFLRALRLFPPLDQMPVAEIS